MNAPQEEGAWIEAADGKRHPIQRSCSLGRTATNTIVLESPKVSRRHALIHVQNIGELWLIDLGSSNGTFLNKRRIHHPVRRQMESEDLDVLLGSWILTCKEIIESRHGIVNKYLGDGFLAYWPDAATTSEEIVAVISALRELQGKKWPEFRFVVHFGAVAIGGVASMGEESLMGGEVNLIFRLEKLASSLSEPCAVSEAAHTKLGELVPVRSLGEFELKGFEGKRAFFAV